VKVLLFLPFPPESPTGNAVTARRIARNLGPLGAEVVLRHLPPTATLMEVIEAIDRDRPDVLLWYHGWKTARWLPATRAARPLPSVVTLTGTDINRDACDPDRRSEVLEALRLADAIVTYSSALRAHLAAMLPEVEAKLERIEKGADLGTAPFTPPAWAAGDVLLFLQPAGVRLEKNNRLAVRALDAVHAQDPRVRLLLAGPVIERAYAEALRGDLASRPWAGHLEGVPHEAMASAYAQSAVVLNTSLSEGLSNAMIEALLCGRPVLASDIEGNREVVEDGVTGLLFRDEADFVAKARLLVADAALRDRLGREARVRAEKKFSSRAEAEGLERVLKLARGRGLGLRVIEGSGPPSDPPRENPFTRRHLQVPQQRLLQVMKFLQMTTQELDQELRTELERNPALTMRSSVPNELERVPALAIHPPLVDAYDPRGPAEEPPEFDGVGRILEARSARVGIDHAGYLLAKVLSRDRARIEGKVVWEVGCGSGVLAALCAKLGAREVWATDVDDQALALAVDTAWRNGVKVHVRKSNLMDLAEPVRPDVVIANLPQKPVPPTMALPVANDGGASGTRLLVPFLEQAAKRMASGGALYYFQHSLAWEEPVREAADRGFERLPAETRWRIFYGDEFPSLLPYWLERREKGLCTFIDLDPGRYAFLCAAWSCRRR